MHRTYVSDIVNIFQVHREDDGSCGVWPCIAALRFLVMEGVKRTAAVKGLTVSADRTARCPGIV